MASTTTFLPPGRRTIRSGVSRPPSAVDRFLEIEVAVLRACRPLRRRGAAAARPIGRGRSASAAPARGGPVSACSVCCAACSDLSCSVSADVRADAVLLDLLELGVDQAQRLLQRLDEVLDRLLASVEVDASRSAGTPPSEDLRQLRGTIRCSRRSASDDRAVNASRIRLRPASSSSSFSAAARRSAATSASSRARSCCASLSARCSSAISALRSSSSAERSLAPPCGFFGMGLRDGERGLKAGRPRPARGPAGLHDEPRSAAERPGQRNSQQEDRWEGDHWTKFRRNCRGTVGSASDIPRSSFTCARTSTNIGLLWSALRSRPWGRSPQVRVRSCCKSAKTQESSSRR